MSNPSIELSEPEQLRLVVAAAQDRKAEDIKVLHLGAVTDFTEHFVILSGTNERQVQAITDSINERLRAAGARPLHIEGYNHANWVLLDYGGDLVVHVFLAETRVFYGLERLWADAPDVTAEFLEDPAGEPPAAAQE